MVLRRVPTLAVFHSLVFAFHRPVYQWLDSPPDKREVGGSSPPRSTKPENARGEYNSIGENTLSALLVSGPCPSAGMAYSVGSEPMVLVT